MSVYVCGNEDKCRKRDDVMTFLKTEAIKNFSGERVWFKAKKYIAVLVLIATDYVSIIAGLTITTLFRNHILGNIFVSLLRKHQPVPT